MRSTCCLTWAIVDIPILLVGGESAVQYTSSPRKPDDTTALNAAEISGDIEAQISLLSTKVRSSCYEDDLESAMCYHERARTLLVSLDRPAPGLITGINYA